MTRVYYKEAVGCFVVYDITRPSTFEAVVRWKEDLDKKVLLPDGSRIPCFLLANKVGAFSDQQPPLANFYTSIAGGRVVTNLPLTCCPGSTPRHGTLALVTDLLGSV